MLVDQVPHHLVQHSRPNSADGVHLGELVDISVDVRVGGQGSRVRVCADSSRAVVDPRTHWVVLRACVTRLETDGRGHEVAPAFAHAAGFESVEAVGVLFVQIRIGVRMDANW